MRGEEVLPLLPLMVSFCITDRHQLRYVLLMFSSKYSRLRWLDNTFQLSAAWASLMGMIGLSLPGPASTTPTLLRPATIRMLREGTHYLLSIGQ